MTITNLKLRALLERENLGFLELEKEEGYFYVWSPNEAAANALVALPSTIILNYSFGQQSIEGWVEDIKSIWRDAESKRLAGGY